MASMTVYVKGKCEWAKLTKPDPKYNNYTINMYLDPESVKVWKESEAQNKTYTNKETNEEYITLRRPDFKLVGKEVMTFGPVEVLDKDNKPFTDLIGNGSEVTCKVTVYDTAKGKGTRLEAVRVETLVPYAKREVLGNVDLAF
jgi:hypothetical protein